jgi:hypothetical protein
MRPNWESTDDLVAENVVSLDQVVAVDSLLNGLFNNGQIPGGDALVCVKNKYPGMSGFCQRVIPSIGKAVCPFEMKDFGGESRGPFDRVIGASSIGDDDFIDHGSDTAESVLDPIFFILNDHAQRDSHYAVHQSTWGAKEKGPDGDSPLFPESEKGNPPSGLFF